MSTMLSTALRQRPLWNGNKNCVTSFIPFSVHNVRGCNVVVTHALSASSCIMSHYNHNTRTLSYTDAVHYLEWLVLLLYISFCPVHQSKCLYVSLNIRLLAIARAPIFFSS